VCVFVCVCVCVCVYVCDLLCASNVLYSDFTHVLQKSSIVPLHSPYKMMQVSFTSIVGLFYS